MNTQKVMTAEEMAQELARPYIGTTAWSDIYSRSKRVLLSFSAQDSAPLLEALTRIDMGQYGEEYKESEQVIAHKALTTYHANHPTAKHPKEGEK